MSLLLDCLLNDEFGSTKQADASLMRFKSKRPTVVLEVGVSEPTNKLYEDAERWLADNSDTKLVILVDITEKGRRKTSNDNWGLSAIDFQEKSRDRLSDDILKWYQSKGISLVGTFELYVHLWYSDHDRRCIMNKATFSPGNLVDLTTIQDYPLRLEHLMPNGSDLDADQHLHVSFPMRRLVDTLQSGLEDVEIERASDLAHEEKKKYRLS